MGGNFPRQSGRSGTRERGAAAGVDDGLGSRRLFDVNFRNRTGAPEGSTHQRRPLQV